MPRSPGAYGPEFLEPGFKENGSYFDAGFQSKVNHYGGNLIISATDVAIPSQGKFTLSFTRTFNGNNLYLPDQAISNEADSPLGEGWVGHYGLLWGGGNPLPGGGTVPHPEFIDNRGARRRFYRHDYLTGNNEIPIVSPGNHQTWISASMDLLLQIDNDSFELLTTSGLKFELARLYNEPDHVQRYAYFVTTRITDSSGNTWDVVYESDPAPYFEHPLVQSITDGLGRSLYFGYITDQLNNKRLETVRFGGARGPLLAEYVYQYPGTHAFLKEHRTGEDRLTTYTNDVAPAISFGSVINAITGIQSRNGGTTAITYELKQIFYRPGDQRFAYVVTHVDKGGHAWDYDYQSTGSSAPQNNEFRVRVTTAAFEGVYTYYTYGSPTVWNTELWKVGLLLRSHESYGAAGARTETDRQLDYARFQLSTEPQADNSSSLVSTSRLLSESVVQDGYTLTTAYPANSYDGLNFPRRIDRPGGVSEEIEYQHVRGGVGGSNPRYLLGLRTSETVKVNGNTVEQTVQHYQNADATVPEYSELYRSANDRLRVDFDYYLTNGVAGSRRGVTYGNYSESYEYENGVPKSVVYPEGPNIVRVVDPIGTIKEETRNGVTKSLWWDNDFRPTLVQTPDTDDVKIAYDDRNHTVTITQGPSESRLSYDVWGRLVERREKVDDGQYAVDTYSDFDAFDRPARQGTRMGASYDLTYDVHGRQRSRVTPGDTHEYAYVTGADGIRTTETLNGSVVVERQVDHYGRIVTGSLNTHQVSYSYTPVSEGIEQTISFSQGLPQRTIVRDWLGNKVSETHPETGPIHYGYSPELWLNQLTRPGSDRTLVRDRRGRLKQVTRPSGAVISTRDYHLAFGFISETVHNGVTVSHADPDGAGRPKTLKLSVPRPLSIPHFTHPLGYLDPTLSIERAFKWDTVQDAAGNAADSYDFELWEGAWFPLVTAVRNGQYPPTLVYRGETRSAGLAFADISFAPAANRWYWFRARAKDANGTIGPFSRSHSFVIGTPITVGSIGAIPTKPEAGLIGHEPQPEARGGDTAVAIEKADAFRPTEPPALSSHAVFEIAIEYDGLGRVSGVKHPDEDLTGVPGHWQKYGFNGQGRHKTVFYEGNPIVRDTTYWDSGLPRAMQMPLLDSSFSQIGSFSVNRTYGALGKLDSHSVTMNDAVIYHASQLAYFDDGFGYIESLFRDDPGLPTTLIEYGYTPLGQLQHFTVSGIVNFYTYDNAGNLTAQNGLNRQGLVAPNINGAPEPAGLDLPPISGTGYSNANQRNGWGYDLDGRLEQDDQWSYTYTDLDQIQNVREQAGWRVAHYLYDADGNRVREVHDHQVVYSIRLPNGQLLSQETQFHSYDWTGAKQDFVYHNRLPIANIRYSRNIEYEFRDRLGSPAVAVQWPLVKYYEYAPYGIQMRKEVLQNLVTLEFTGQERDRYTDRDYMMARYHDPRYGRFTRPDPATEYDDTNPISFNLYSYVRGNPMNLVDPKGLWSAAAWGVVRAIGGLAEAGAGVGLAAATGWSGIGALAGVTVAAHGADQFIAGIRQALSDDPVDSFTSQSLQDAGVSQSTANYIDDGVSVVGSLGAGVATAALKVAAIRLADPLAKGLSTASILWRTEVGSQALINDTFNALGGSATTPLAKAQLLRCPGVNAFKGLTPTLLKTGITPLANVFFGAVGAGAAIGNSVATTPSEKERPSN